MPINSFLYPGAKFIPGYEVANSCRFDDGSSAYMHKTPGSAGNQIAFTISLWCKRGTLGTKQTLFSAVNDANNETECHFETDDTLNFRDNEGGSWMIQKRTNQVFRDCSAWYHLVFSSVSGTQKIWVNGVEVTSWHTNTNGSGTATWNDDNVMTVGAKNDGSSPQDYFDGHIAEFVSIDGSTLTPTSFGEFDEDSPRIWKPKDVSGLTFGTNGFYLDFEDSSNLGNDANGGTDLTEVNLAATDQATDTPTNNFATWNPLAYSGKTAMAEGNLQGYGDDDGSQNEGGVATIGVSAGKWFWENKISAVGGGASVGIYPDTTYNTISNVGTELHQGDPSIFYKSDGNKQVDDSASSYGDSYTTNDIIGVALNLDDNEIKFYKNGTVQNSGTAISVTSISPAFYFPVQAGVTNSSVIGNFGNPPYANSSSVADENGYGAFEHTVPNGFYSICTQNIKEFG